MPPKAGASHSEESLPLLPGDRHSARWPGEGETAEVLVDGRSVLIEHIESIRGHLSKLESLTLGNEAEIDATWQLDEFKEAPPRGECWEPHVILERARRKSLVSNGFLSTTSAAFSCKAKTPRGPSITSRRSSDARSEIDPVPLDGVKTLILKQFSTQQSSRALMPSADTLKQDILSSITRGETEMEHLYRRKGFFQTLCKSDLFKNVSVGVILFNLVWIAVDIDNNKADTLLEAPLVYRVVANAFCCFFVFEMLAKLLAVREHRRCDAFKDSIFRLDFVLMLLAVWETWIQELLLLLTGTGSQKSQALLRFTKMLRLMRVCRVTRMIRFMPEMMVMLKGMMAGAKSVLGTLLLLAVVIYTFAILLTELLSREDNESECFSRVPSAVHCLLMMGVFPDQRDFIESLWDANNIQYYLLALVYFLFTTLTIMNMLIALMCEVIKLVSDVELFEQTVRGIEELVQQCLDHCGIQEQVLKQKDVHRVLDTELPVALHNIGVDVVKLVEELWSLFREGNHTLTLSEFYQVIFQCLGSKKEVETKSFLSSELVRIGTQRYRIGTDETGYSEYEMARETLAEMAAPRSFDGSPGDRDIESDCESGSSMARTLVRRPQTSTQHEYLAL